jgi:RNA polymerase sigma-70 factor (ECF subfamily)
MAPSDVVQESLTDAWKDRGGFKGGSQRELIAWLGQIVDNNVQDAIRKHLLAAKREVGREQVVEVLQSSAARGRSVLAADGLSPRSETARRESLHRIARCLESLPARQRDAVRMRYLEDCTLGDLAAHFGCSKNSAAQLLARGLKSIKRMCQSDESPE